MIHSCGMVDLTDDIAATDGFGRAAEGALRAGAPILCDVQMVASGVTRKRLPADNAVLCTLNDPAVPGLARDLGTTRSAGRARAVAPAPRRRARRHRQRPYRPLPPPRAARRRGARTGRDHRRAGRIRRRGREQGRADRASLAPPSLIVRGRRGGSAIACGCRQRPRLGGPSDDGPPVRRRARPRRPRPHDRQGAAPHRGVARDRVSDRGAADGQGRGAVDRRAVPDGGTHARADGLPRHDRHHRHPGGSRARSRTSTTPRRTSSPRTWMRGAMSSCCARATRSSTARTCTCTSGSRTATRPRSYPASRRFSGAAAAAGLPLVKRDDVLVVAPGTLPADELRAHLKMADAAVVMKLGGGSRACGTRWRQRAWRRAPSMWSGRHRRPSASRRCATSRPSACRTCRSCSRRAPTKAATQRSGRRCRPARRPRGRTPARPQPAGPRRPGLLGRPPRPPDPSRAGASRSSAWDRAARRR